MRGWDFDDQNFLAYSEPLQPSSQFVPKKIEYLSFPLANQRGKSRVFYSVEGSRHTNKVGYRIFSARGDDFAKEYA